MNPYLSAMIGFVSGMLGALFTFFLNFQFERWKDRRNRARATASQFLNHMEELEQIATEYWSANFHRLSKEQAEMAIKTEMRDISHYFDSIQWADKRYRDACYASLLQLRHLVTGGEFESATVKADMEKLARITLRCSDIKRYVKIHSR